MQKLNFVAISVYFILLNIIWISHYNPNIISFAPKVNTIKVTFDIDRPISKPKFPIYLTNLNKELAESKPDFKKQDVGSFFYYYVTYDRVTMRVR